MATGSFSVTSVDFSRRVAGLSSTHSRSLGAISARVILSASLPAVRGASALAASLARLGGAAYAPDEAVVLALDDAVDSSIIGGLLLATAVTTPAFLSFLGFLSPSAAIAAVARSGPSVITAASSFGSASPTSQPAPGSGSLLTSIAALSGSDAAIVGAVVLAFFLLACIFGVCATRCPFPCLCKVANINEKIVGANIVPSPAATTIASPSSPNTSEWEVENPFSGDHRRDRDRISLDFVGARASAPVQMVDLGDSGAGAGAGADRGSPDSQATLRGVTLSLRAEAHRDISGDEAVSPASVLRVIPRSSPEVVPATAATSSIVSPYHPAMLGGGGGGQPSVGGWGGQPSRLPNVIHDTASLPDVIHDTETTTVDALDAWSPPPRGAMWGSHIGGLGRLSQLSLGGSGAGSGWGSPPLHTAHSPLPRSNHPPQAQPTLPGAPSPRDAIFGGHVSPLAAALVAQSSSLGFGFVPGMSRLGRGGDATFKPTAPAPSTPVFAPSNYLASYASAIAATRARRALITAAALASSIEPPPHSVASSSLRHGAIVQTIERRKVVKPVYTIL